MTKLSVLLPHTWGEVKTLVRDIAERAPDPTATLKIVNALFLGTLENDFM